MQNSTEGRRNATGGNVSSELSPLWALRCSGMQLNAPGERRGQHYLGPKAWPPSRQPPLAPRPLQWVVRASSPMRSGGCTWAGPTSLVPATLGLPGLSRRVREALRPWHHVVRCLCPRRSWDMLSGYGSGGSLGCDALAWSRGLLAAVLTSMCGVRVPSEYGCHAFVSSR
jgi:hypothetical protein